jgi:lysophospholipase L1-like esterase
MKPLRFAVLGVLRTAAVQLVILACLIVAADVLLWLALPVANLGVLSHHIRNQNVYGLKQQVLYRTIGHRVRSATMSKLSKPMGSRRVLCIGASTTDQANQNIEDTWCARLVTEASAGHDRTDFHTVSYGRGGDRVVDTAKWLREMIDIVEPDVVVTLLGINDLAWGGGPSYELRTVDGPGRPHERAIREQRFLQKCAEFSQICRRISLVWNDFVVRANIGAGRMVNWDTGNLPNLQNAYRALPAVEEVVRDPDPIEEFQGGVVWLLDFLKRRDIDVVVLGQPVLWRPDLPVEESDTLWFSVAASQGKVRPRMDWLVNEMKRYNSIQQREALARGFAYVDLNGKVPQSREYFFDDCHFTDIGSFFVAKLVGPSLQAVLRKQVARKRGSP